MDAYPLNLILAVATASATIFLGFLPTKNISSAFFARETGKALIAWIIVALLSPTKIFHYPLFFAFFCFASWWHFRRDRALNGKMWLSLASGLGISIGVMTILAVTPQAYPPGLPPFNETLLLASIYLGGAIIGLAYVCFALIQGTKANSGVTQGIIQRYVGLLPYLTVFRAAVILATFFSTPGRLESKETQHTTTQTGAITYDYIFAETAITVSNTSLIVLGLSVVVLPVLAFIARKQIGFSSRIQPTRFLIAIILVGLLTEILARLLVF